MTFIKIFLIYSAKNSINVLNKIKGRLKDMFNVNRHKNIRDGTYESI